MPFKFQILNTYTKTQVCHTQTKDNPNSKLSNLQKSRNLESPKTENFHRECKYRIK